MIRFAGKSMTMVTYLYDFKDLPVSFAFFRLTNMLGRVDVLQNLNDALLHVALRGLLFVFIECANR